MRTVKKVSEWCNDHMLLTTLLGILIVILATIYIYYRHPVLSEAIDKAITTPL